MTYTFFVVLIVIAALLMIAVVLIQESKGGGLSSQFSSTNSIMGVKKTTDFVEKVTWSLAIFMVVVSVVCAYVAPCSAADESVMEKAATQTQTTNPMNTPGFGAGKQAAPATQQTAPAAQGKPATAPASAPAK